MAKEHPNLKPNPALKDPKVAAEMGRKGGKASGKTRRRKANLKRVMEDILTLDLPTSKIKRQLEDMGLDPTMEQGLVLSVVLSAIQSGDYRALETIRKIIGQDTTLADRREQKARTEKMQAETQRIEDETARKSGDKGAELAQMQATAIAEMINTSSAERALQDFLKPLEGGEDGEPIDSVQPSEPEAE